MTAASALAWERRNHGGPVGRGRDRIPAPGVVPSAVAVAHRDHRRAAAADEHQKRLLAPWGRLDGEPAVFAASILMHAEQ